MENITKKVIMASAGTGKTYRLSLEFITLLLKNKNNADFDFSQIYVMTFTKKATAEIRENILGFMDTIAYKGEGYAGILESCQKSCNYDISDEDIEYIKTKILPDILKRKDLLQISTIDSFTTNIFRTMIAPYLKINDFSIDVNANMEIHERLLSYIFSDSVFPVFKPIFSMLNLRTVEKSITYLDSMISNRWILDFYDKSQLSGDVGRIMKIGLDSFTEELDAMWVKFKEDYMNLVRKYDEVIQSQENKVLSKVFLKDYKTLLSFQENSDIELLAYFGSFLANKEYVLNNISTIVDKVYPFAVSRKKAIKPIENELKIEFDQVLSQLCDCYIFDRIMTKQEDIIKAWRLLCQEYDRLKMSLAKFTYDDITYYTNRYLYEESLSLIDRDRNTVTNVFYEQLVSRIRYMLIDEFQDTSITQYSILIPIISELISGYSMKDTSGVIVVGDGKQSIYGWRGGERGLMSAMQAVLGVEPESLSTCYRSNKDILSFVNKTFSDQVFQQDLAQQDMTWDYQDVDYQDDSNAEVYYWEYNKAKENHKEADEFKVFAQEISDLLEKGAIDLGNTAILVRRKTDASQIATALNNLNINNNIESSEKLLNNGAVKLIYLLFKYKLLRDDYSFLSFLRSDLVLLSSDKLALVLQKLNTFDKYSYREIDYKILLNDSYVNEILELINREYSSMSDFFEAILGKFDFANVCANETDWKNIYVFKQLLINFEMGKLQVESFDLYGFVEYCSRQKEDTSEILEQGLKLNDSISILTIHKSKGLGFDNVFVFMNLANNQSLSSSGGFNNFTFLYGFEGNKYQSFNDLLIQSSSSDLKIVKASGFSDLLDFPIKKEIIEEIDVYYVALTRAKKNLGLFINYKFKNGMEDYIETMHSNKRVIARLVQAYKQHFQEIDASNYSDEDRVFFKYSSTEDRSLPEQEDNKITNIQTKIWLADYISQEKCADFEENVPIVDMKRVFLEDKQQLIGTVAHYFLSFISYGSQEELSLAWKMVMQDFGSLLSFADLEYIYKMCCDFIEENADLFSTEWDVIFNEKVVYDNSQELRIDRMMVSHKRKEVTIIDYKTGKVSDSEQVNRYISIIESMDFVKENKYIVSGKFVKVV